MSLYDLSGIGQPNYLYYDEEDGGGGAGSVAAAQVAGHHNDNEGAVAVVDGHHGVARQGEQPEQAPSRYSGVVFGWLGGGLSGLFAKG